MLSDTQIERYSRQILLPQVGGRGQIALLSATVTVYGSQALATTAALYLAAAGVGHLRVSPPTAAAIAGVNPDCEVASPAAVSAADTVPGAAAVLCAGAGAATCAVIDAACLAAGIPLIIGEATGTVGWLSVRNAPDAACATCLAPPRADTGDGDAPLGGVAAALIGTLLATEAVKIVLGLQPSYVGHRVTFDVLAGDVRDEPVTQDPRCPVCGSGA
jgi:molybdopterin/thiamine biosynthesis adenylyltransferase